MGDAAPDYGLLAIPFIAFTSMIVVGLVIARRSAARTKEHFHFYEGGLVYAKGGRIEAIPWQRMLGMSPYGVPRGWEQPRGFTGYYLVVGADIVLMLGYPAANDIVFDPRRPSGRSDPFIDWLAATMRRHGLLAE